MGYRITELRRLVRWSQRAKGLRPVFIVGEMRSGTSILYRVLLRHPAFAPRSFHLTEPHAVHALVTQPRLDTAPPSMRGFFYGDEERYDMLIAAIRAAAPWRTPAVRLACRQPENIALFRLALSGVAVRAFVAAATEARECRRLVDKTADNLPHARHLLAALPQAKLLYIVRHPIDTFSSYRRRYRNDPAATWAKLSVEEFARRWGANALVALELAKAQPESFRIVRYERFTSDPPAAFAEICAFLDELYEPVALELWEDRPAWPLNPKLMGEIAPNTRVWKEQIAAADAAEVEDRLAGAMRALGYARYTEATPVGA